MEINQNIKSTINAIYIKKKKQFYYQNNENQCFTEKYLFIK